MENLAIAPRVCLLLESFHPKIGGGETHARLLGAQLVHRGLPVFVLTQRQDRSWPRQDAVDGVPVWRVGVPGAARFGKFLMMPAALLALLRRRRDYDIVYVCGFRTLGVVAVVASWLTGCRCVLRAEACGELAGEDPIHPARPGVGRSVLRMAVRARNLLLRRADRFLSISRAITDEYRANGVPPERLVEITNGIDTARFSPVAAAEKQALRRRLALPDRTLCTYTGKLNRGKGLPILLRAWRRLAERWPQLHLVLVGSGAHQFLSCEAELRRFTARHGLDDRVTFTGAASRVEEYLRASDVFVFPSESESLGISLIEAMACGLPAVTTRVGGIPDVVDDGVNGRLIEVDDEDALVAAIEELVRQPALAAQLGQAARTKVVEVFGIDAVADAHERLFRALLAPPAAAPRVGYASK